MVACEKRNRTNHAALSGQHRTDHLSRRTFELPEWKTKAQGKNLSYGQVSSKSIKEQREGLPIAKLKTQLCDAIAK